MIFGILAPKNTYLRNRKSLLMTVGLLILLGLCTQLFAAYVLSQILAMMPEVGAAYESLVVELTEYDFGILAYTILLAPVLEELVFRVGIMWIGMKFMPFIMVNIMQALLFGMYHGNWVQGIYAFLIGMLLGLVYYKSKWVLSSFILHISINICGVMIEYTPLSSEEFPEKTLIMLVTVAAAIGAFIVWYLLKLWNGEENIKFKLP